MTDAADIRRRMRAMRRALDEKAQQQAADAVYRRLVSLDIYRNARCVMAYAACRGELALQRIMEDILAGGRELALPRCEAPGVMTARRVDSLSRLTTGAYGLPEPDACCAIIDPTSIDLILTPGTAFDLKGGRIGQGGGYYDRFLPKTKAITIGVCHDFALLEHVPAALHDYRMDMIVTPLGVIRAQEDKR